LFQKTGARLVVSHVQMTAYLKTAPHALRLVLQAAAHPTTKEKFQSRGESGMACNLPYQFGQTATTRAIIPLLGWTAQPEIIRMKSYSFGAGLNGALGGSDHDLIRGKVEWSQPNLTIILRAKRNEPVTLYAFVESGASR
jgi:hypothetical protein